MATVYESLQKDLVDIISLAHGDIDDGYILIEDLGVPHVAPKSLPAGKMAVYAFFYGDHALKVGKAGPRSEARYTSQHYNAGSAPSTLAASVVNKPDMIGIDALSKEEAGAWLKENTRRVNILLNKDLGVEVLNLVEAFLICRFSPVYEGFDSQR